MNEDSIKCICNNKGWDLKGKGAEQRYRFCPVCFDKMTVDDRQRVRREINDWTIKMWKLKGETK